MKACMDLYIKCQAMFSDDKSFSYAEPFPEIERKSLVSKRKCGVGVLL